MSFRAPDAIDLLNAEWDTVRTYRLPNGLTARSGTWSAGVFHVFAQGTSGQGFLTLTPSLASLGNPVAVQWPAVSPRTPTFVPAEPKLVAFQRYGSGLIGTPDQANRPFFGGAFVIDPRTGIVVRWILPDLFVRDLVVSADGRELFAVQDWPRPDPVRFVRVDLETGAVLANATLRPNTRAPAALEEQWTLAFVNMPSSLVPRGEVRPRPCQ